MAATNSADLPLEALPQLRIGGEVGWQDVDGDRALQSRARRLEHLGHPFFAELGQDLEGPDSSVIISPPARGA